MELSLPYPSPITAKKVIALAVEQFCKDSEALNILMDHFTTKLGTSKQVLIDRFTSKAAVDNLWSWLEESHNRNNLYVMAQITQSLKKQETPLNDFEQNEEFTRSSNDNFGILRKDLDNYVQKVSEK